MFEKFKSMLTQGRQKTKSYDGSVGYGYTPYSLEATMACYQTGSYDNNYPAISRIAERFAITLPYAVDAQGERLREVPAGITALYNPNRQMSSIRFFKALAVMALVHPNVYLLVWRREGNRVLPGGDIRADNIAGFTFLESPTVRIDKSTGRITYQSLSKVYTDMEVITLSLDIDPYAILAGYSPSIASKKWATIDDYIAAYQAGFFKNGAIPAGEFIITAPTVEEYNDIVDELQKRHRGAGNNNNVIYTHRPTNTVDGKPLEAQVEWVPFSQGNKNLSLKEIFEQAEKVRDMTFGVPREVKGYLQNSNYASATTAEHIFDKYVVLPKLTQIWTDFTHELNRITGGLGYAISFDFDVTALADEEKVKNETTKVQLDTLARALDMGFSLESAVDALDLPNSFKNLSLQTPPAIEKPEVDDGLPNGASQTETSVKSVKTKAADPNPEDISPEMREIIEAEMQMQIDRAIAEQNYETTKKEEDEFAEALLTVLLALMQMNGATQYDRGVVMVNSNGAPISDSLPQYQVSDVLKESYRNTLQEVARSYDADTANSIRRILDQANTEGWDKEATATKLREIMNTDEWRVQRLARSETHRANGLASVDAMEQIHQETGVEFYKTWHLNPATRNHCEYCIALDGTTLPLSTPFIEESENGFIDQQSADAHPNCGCFLSYSMAPTAQAKSVKVKCPECGRHLFESKGGSVEGIKCQGCKKHFDIVTKNGEVEAKEVEKHENC